MYSTTQVVRGAWSRSWSAVSKYFLARRNCNAFVANFHLGVSILHRSSCCCSCYQTAAASIRALNLLFCIPQSAMPGTFTSELRPSMCFTIWPMLQVANFSKDFPSQNRETMTERTATATELECRAILARRSGLPTLSLRPWERGAPARTAPRQASPRSSHPSFKTQGPTPQTAQSQPQELFWNQKSANSSVWVVSRTKT